MLDSQALTKVSGDIIFRLLLLFSAFFLLNGQIKWAGRLICFAFDYLVMVVFFSEAKREHLVLVLFASCVLTFLSFEYQAVLLYVWRIE